MIHLRIIILPALLLFLLNGCIQSLYNTSISQDKNPALSETNPSAIIEPVEKVNNTNQKSVQVAPCSLDSPLADTENKIRVFITNDAEKQEYEIDKNTLPAKKIQSKKIQSKKIQSFLDEALEFCETSQNFWQKGELENAIEALDQAYSLILEVDNYDEPKLMQQKEDLRFMISKRILEIYASRNIVVNGNHNAIPMVMNKHIQTEINLFKGKEKKFFIRSYKNSGKFRPHIVAALKEAGLPVELSWLPLIESGFKVNALSKARALGLWQFIPSTGYKFGLKRNMCVDERLDPIKSTKAAIAYLKELHQIFGDWTTVLAAYNCGEGRVLRVIRNQNVNYLDNFWDLHERLPRETARYVPKFMATLHILNNPEKYGLDLIDVDLPLKYETVTISKQVHLKDIAKKISATEKILKKLNPELRYNILPQDQYSLRVPPGKDVLLLASMDEIPASLPPRRAFIKHKVRSGETLSTIAQRYHSSIKSIAGANNLHKYNYIVAGKILKIPQKGTIISRPKKQIKSKYNKASAHVVKSGDSLWIIARRFNTTTKKLQALNNLSSTKLKIGQILKIREYSDEVLTDNGLKRYQVKRGDSPFQIAKLHNMPLKRFLRANRLTPGCKIYPGQQLYIE